MNKHNEIGNVYGFLRSKFAKVSFLTLLVEQFEALVVGLVRSLPTILGICVRNVVYRLLGMKASGIFWIQPGVTIVNLRKLKVGRNFGCNSGTYINAVGGVSMGDDVLLGSNVTVSSGKHEIEGRESSVFSRPVTPLEITFGNDVWIGSGATILPGIHVASGTVVGANAVVTKDTLPYSVMVGLPAKVIRYR
jgi:maltose O-acetyltransferase